MNRKQVINRWRLWQSELAAMARKGRKINEDGAIAIANILAASGWAITAVGALYEQPDYDLAFASWMVAIDRVYAL